MPSFAMSVTTMTKSRNWSFCNAGHSRLTVNSNSYEEAVRVFEHRYGRSPDIITRQSTHEEYRRTYGG